jgi:hypothetical protein
MGKDGSARSGVVKCEANTAGVSMGEVRAVAQQIRGLLQPDWVNALQASSSQAVYTPLVTVTLMILQRLLGNASLAKAVSAGLEASILPGSRPDDARKMSLNTGAFSRARGRLEVELAEQVGDRVFEALVAATPPSFADRRVYTLDGTSFTLASDDALRDVYPAASNQYGESPWPVMRGAVAHELASGCALRPEIGPMYGAHAVSEIELGIQLLPRIPADSIVMADRGFGIFYFAQAVQTAGLQFVARLTKTRFKALQRDATPIGAGRWECVWRPSRWDRTHHPDLPGDAAIPVHLHEIEVPDANNQPLKLYLVTTLVEVAADAAMWARLYRCRWYGENDIRDVKVVLKMEQLRGHSDAMLRKELALGFAAYNVVVQVRRLAAKQADLQPRRLSFTGVWDLVQTFLLKPNQWTTDEYAHRFEFVLAGALQRKLPNRPDRHYPRAKHSNAAKYPTRPKKPPKQSTV